MGAERPSTPLIALLVGSLLLAGWVYGRPLVSGSTDVDDTFIESDSLSFVDEEDEAEAETEPWTAPEEPRNPFLPVDTGAPITTPDDQDGAEDPDLDP